MPAVLTTMSSYQDISPPDLYAIPTLPSPLDYYLPNSLAVNTHNPLYTSPYYSWSPGDEPKESQNQYSLNRFDFEENNLDDYGDVTI